MTGIVLMSYTVRYYRSFMQIAFYIIIAQDHFRKQIFRCPENLPTSIFPVLPKIKRSALLKTIYTTRRMCESSLKLAVV